MINKTEKDERNYLEITKNKIKNTVNKIFENATEMSKELLELKDYLWENKNGMDRMEKEAVRSAINQNAMLGETTVRKKSRLLKLLDSPYFGRVDFKTKYKVTEYPTYIGIHSFFDDETKENLIHDWRAPISSLFYDFELGNAYYEAPTGKIDGEITLKRQYRIRKGTLEFMLESSFNVYDDILQKELSLTSDERMKNIVATIQRDQNKIIRNISSQVLIIQGVAGSGKTSIALHRIAFLLYKFKNELKSDDILIISPNKVFSDYISNVLPELGEDEIPQTGMEDLANEIFDNKIKFQTYYEQINILAENNDNNLSSRIRIKSTFDFIEELNKFIEHIEKNYFVPIDLKIDNFAVPQTVIRQKYQNFFRVPVFARPSSVAEAIADYIKIKYKNELKKQQINKIAAEITKMFKTTNLKNIYKDFFDWLEMTEFLNILPKNVYEYSDVFPLVYLKIKLEGIKTYKNVKHLIIDEMQDYSPVQYAVLSLLFPCKKTILGDINQSINPNTKTTAYHIKKVFDNADIMKLNKSYRSTFEITEFAQKIIPNDSLEAVERYGESVKLHKSKNSDEEIKKITEIIADFKKSEYNSLGIICKTQKQAEKMYGIVEKIDQKAYMLNYQSTAFYKGVIVTSAHLAKGLEFDCVLVPETTEKNYNSNIDRSMLYVACTRAMHKLYLTFSGEISQFVN